MACNAVKLKMSKKGWRRTMVVGMVGMVVGTTGRAGCVVTKELVRAASISVSTLLCG